MIVTTPMGFWLPDDWPRSAEEYDAAVMRGEISHVVQIWNWPQVRVREGTPQLDATECREPLVSERHDEIKIGGGGGAKRGG